MVSSQELVLPARHYYTVKQAANEINKALNTNSVDEDYLLHLGATQRLRLYFKTYLDVYVSPIFSPVENDLVSKWGTNFLQNAGVRPLFIRARYNILREIESQGCAMSYGEHELVIPNDKSFQNFMNGIPEVSSGRFYRDNAKQFINFTEVLNAYYKYFEESSSKESLLWGFSFGRKVENKDIAAGEEVDIDRLFIFDNDLIALKNGKILIGDESDFILDQQDTWNNLIKKPQGSSRAKQDAQLAARTLARYLWLHDSNETTMTDMCIKIMIELHGTEHASQLPDQPISLKDWIRSVAPTYATKGGRRPQKK